MSDAFGDLPADPAEKPTRLVVPTRAANPIEQDLRAMMHEAIPAVPMVFYEDGEHDANDFIPIFGRPLNLDEAMAASAIIAEPVVERYRRQICIARDLGPKGTLAEYHAACLIEGVNPILVEKTS